MMFGEQYNVFDLMGNRIGTAYKSFGSGCLGVIVVAFVAIELIVIYTFFEQLFLGMKSLFQGNLPKAKQHFVFPLIVVGAILLLNIFDQVM